MNNTDRQTRDQLADLIETFTTGKITNFNFDKSINDLKSKDPLISFCIQHLWFLYDDIKEHYAVLDKKEWDFCYRLMLLLRSDCQVHMSKTRMPFKQCIEKNEEDNIDTCFPFTDFKQLMQIRRDTPSFQKVPYPKEIEYQNIWSENEQKLMHSILIIFFPVAIILKLFGCLLYREMTLHIKPKGTQ
ncbi:MAG: hypothetical protein L3J47_08645 [Sulfurovum sp.]|nr:hypothetical protein [Sulfurovum sp.]